MYSTLYIWGKVFTVALMASKLKISLRVGEYYFRKNHSLDRVFIIEVYIFGVTIMKTTMNSLLCANDSSWN